MSRKDKLPNSGRQKVMDQIAEQDRAVQFWCNHIAYLRKQGLVGGFALQGLLDLGVTNTRKIGYQKGQFRPGRILGQVDVFHALSERFSALDCFLLSGISPIELAIFRKTLQMERIGVDPNNPDEVREFNRVEQMSPREIN